MILCEECKYRGADNQCRVNPPVASNCAKGIASWPSIKLTDSCGNGKAVPGNGKKSDKKDEE